MIGNICLVTINKTVDVTVSIKMQRLNKSDFCSVVLNRIKTLHPNNSMLTTSFKALTCFTDFRWEGNLKVTGSN